MIRLGDWFDAAEYLLWLVVASGLWILYLAYLRPAIAEWWHRRTCAMCRDESLRVEVWRWR